MNTVMPDIQLHIIGNSQVVWNVPGKLQIITSQLAGRFPDVQRVIPQKPSATILKVNKKEMLKACNLVELFANQGSGLATLIATSDKVRLMTAEETVGNADYDVTAKDFSGSPSKVNLNARYLKEAVESFSGDEIRFALNGDRGPILLTAADEEKLTQLMMPMVLS
jgi:DNA polymerase III sliding clamp (beta) subunit (PCNA family)